MGHRGGRAAQAWCAAVQACSHQPQGTTPLACLQAKPPAPAAAYSQHSNKPRVVSDASLPTPPLPSPAGGATRPQPPAPALAAARRKTGWPPLPSRRCPLAAARSSSCRLANPAPPPELGARGPAGWRPAPAPPCLQSIEVWARKPAHGPAASLLHHAGHPNDTSSKND